MAMRNVDFYHQITTIFGCSDDWCPMRCRRELLGAVICDYLPLGSGHGLEYCDPCSFPYCSARQFPHEHRMESTSPFEHPTLYVSNPGPFALSTARGWALQPWLFAKFSAWKVSSPSAVPFNCALAGWDEPAALAAADVCAAFQQPFSVITFPTASWAPLFRAKSAASLPSPFPAIQRKAWT